MIVQERETVPQAESRKLAASSPSSIASRRLPVLPPGVAPNAGSWAGLARAAAKLHGTDNMEVSIKPGGAVEVRGL